MKALLPLLVLVVACSHASKGSHTATELTRATLALNQGMPASQIQQVLGPPDETGISPCQARSGVQATCTTWMYRAQTTDLNGSRNLRVWLQGEPPVLSRWEWF